MPIPSKTELEARLLDLRGKIETKVKAQVQAEQEKFEASAAGIRQHISAIRNAASALRHTGDPATADTLEAKIPELEELLKLQLAIEDAETQLKKLDEPPVKARGGTSAPMKIVQG